MPAEKPTPAFGLLGEPSEFDGAGVGRHGLGRLEGVADAVGGEADGVGSAERTVGTELLTRNRLQQTGVGVRFDEHVVGHRAARRTSPETMAPTLAFAVVYAG